METKMQDNEFLVDTELLLRPNEKNYPKKEYETIRKEFIEKI